MNKDVPMTSDQPPTPAAAPGPTPLPTNYDIRDPNQLLDLLMRCQDGRMTCMKAKQYIEQTFNASDNDLSAAKLELGQIHGRIGLFAEKWWLINNNLATDEIFKQIEEQLIDNAKKYLEIMGERDEAQLRAGHPRANDHA
jgi:hypothetical protein